MRSKNLIILFAVLIVLLVGVLVFNVMKQPDPKGIMGMPFFKSLAVNEITSITIKGAEESVSLLKKGDRWVVGERFDQPAEFAKISGLVKKLKGLKIGRSFKSTDEREKRLAITNPDKSGVPAEEKGTLILLKDDKDKPLGEIVLGKARRTGEDKSIPNGHYVKRKEGSEIYLVDAHFAYLKTAPAEWLNKRMLEVPPEDIRKIAAFKDDRQQMTYSLERPDKDADFALAGLPEGRKLNDEALERLNKALASLNMEDVIDPDAIPASESVQFKDMVEFTLFNGLVYRAYPSGSCNKDSRCYGKVEVHVSGKPDGAELTKETDEKDLFAETPEDYQKLKERLNPWVFIIYKYQHDSFVTDLADLLAAER